MPEYREVAPNEKLKSIVRNYWIISYDENVEVKDYLFPSTLCYLFYVKTPVNFDVHFVRSGFLFSMGNGFHLTSLNSLVEFKHKGLTAIGACIYPIYISLLFKENPTHLVNKVKKVFDMPSIPWNKFSPDAFIMHLEAVLIKRVAENPIRKEVDYIYKQMVHDKLYRSSVEDIAQWVGFSSRHLSNLFKKHLGLSPKKFLGLMRFNHALELINKNADLNLSEIAYDLGYHDQSHFVRDFKKACGKTPKELMGAIDPGTMAQFFKLY